MRNCSSQSERMAVGEEKDDRFWDFAETERSFSSVKGEETLF